MRALITLFLLMTPSLAMAVPSDFWGGLVTGDLASDITSDLFSNNGVVFELLKIVTSVSIIAGTILLIYVSVGGILGTAIHGEFLGKRWSAITPMRMAIGLALAMPLPGSGLSIAQHAVIEIPRISIGAASAVWRDIVDGLGSNISVTPPPTPDDPSVAVAMLRGMVCQGIAIREGYIEPNDAIVFQNLPANDHTVTQLKFGHRAQCGTITWTSGYTPTGKMASVKNAIAASIEPSMRQLYRDLQPLASAIVVDDLRGRFPGKSAQYFGKYVSTASERYYKSVAQVAYSAINATRDSRSRSFADETKERGWVSAGGYYYSLIQDQAVMSDTVNSSIPNIHLPNNGLGNIVNESGLLNTLAQRQSIINEIAAAAISKDTGLLTSASADGVIAARIASSIDGVGEILEGDSHPMLKMKNIGDTLSAGATSMIATAASGSLVKGLASRIPIIGGAADKFADLMQSIVMSVAPKMLLFGFLFGVALPLIPYFLWLLAVAGFFWRVVQAAVIAPFSIILLGQPGGHEYLGGSLNGILHILMLMLRPLLMLVGLVAAMHIFTLLAGTVDETLWGILDTVVGSAGYTLFAFFSGLVVYLGLMLILAFLSFYFISKLPDFVEDFIGSMNGRDGLTEGEVQHALIATGNVGGNMAAGATGVASGAGAAGAASGAGRQLSNGVSQLGKTAQKSADDLNAGVDAITSKAGMMGKGFGK